MEDRERDTVGYLTSIAYFPDWEEGAACPIFESLFGEGSREGIVKTIKKYSNRFS